MFPVNSRLWLVESEMIIPREGIGRGYQVNVPDMRLGDMRPLTFTMESTNSWSNSVLTLLRFIPNREGQDLQASFSLLHDDGSPATPSKQKKRTPHGELHFQKSKMYRFHALNISLAFYSRRSKPDVYNITSIRNLR